jgi:hypothetical protein
MAENIMSGRTKSNPPRAMVETQLGPPLIQTPTAISPDASFSNSLFILCLSLLWLNFNQYCQQYC